MRTRPLVRTRIGAENRGADYHPSVTAELRPDPLVGLLSRISEILESVGEPQWARQLRGLAAAAGAEDPSAQRALAADVLALFKGMGSFNDIVLQNKRGVLPEQGEFDRLRSELFEAARGQLW